MQNNLCPKCSQPALNGTHTDPWQCISALRQDNDYLRRILDEYKALADKRLIQLAEMEALIPKTKLKHFLHREK